MSKHRLQQWIIEIWHWLVEAKLVFMGILVVVAVMLLGFVTWQSEDSIRIGGYALQFIGMIFAVIGLLRVRAHFRKPLLRRLLLDWARRYPKWKRDVNIYVGSPSRMSITGLSARIGTGSYHPKATSIDQRINAIEKDIGMMRSKQIELEESISKLKNSNEEHKKKIAEENTKIKKDIQLDLESLHTSDLLTSLIGLVWLTIGITMSTLSKELSKCIF